MLRNLFIGKLYARVKFFKRTLKVKRQVINKGDKLKVENNINWKHPGGKLRRAGSSTCSETELLAIILGSGSSGKTAEQIAQQILDKYGTLPKLMGISLKELMRIKGLKEVKATQIAAVFEVARRIVKHLEKE